MKYLVTGGAGFIGSHLVEYLVGKGECVRVLDNISSGKKENVIPFLKNIEFIEGDIRDTKTCHESCRGIDFVLHQAALGSVPRSIDDPLTTNEINVTGTLNMLLAARDAKVKRYIFASSSSVYGDAPVLPKVETMSANPLSPYALSKYTGECYTLLFHKLYRLETIALRYFNVFGPRQDPDSQYAAVIPRFISLLLKGEKPVIFGEGNQTRDFTYVADVVQANISSCFATPAACGQIYNIAGGKKISITDLYYLIRQILSEKKQTIAEVEPAYQSSRPGDVRESLADIALAGRFLGNRTGVLLKEGLKKTIESLLDQNLF